MEQEAYDYIKKHSDELIDRFCTVNECHPVVHPITLFMAGSPGAGKTEASKELMRRFEDIPIRIDADEIREFCPGYTGRNAHHFQRAATKGVHTLYEHALKHDINCIIDGTFAYASVEGNIERSLKRKRHVEIWYVYQDPKQSWELTKAREMVEMRRVTKDVFIHTFFNSQKNVRNVKQKFGGSVSVNVLKRNFETDSQYFRLNVSISELDRIVDTRYSEEELASVLI